MSKTEHEAEHEKQIDSKMNARIAKDKTRKRKLKTRNEAFASLSSDNSCHTGSSLSPTLRFCANHHEPEALSRPDRSSPSIAHLRYTGDGKSTIRRTEKRVVVERLQRFREDGEWLDADEVG